MVWSKSWAPQELIGVDHSDSQSDLAPAEHPLPVRAAVRLPKGGGLAGREEVAASRLCAQGCGPGRQGQRPTTGRICKTRDEAMLKRRSVFDFSALGPRIPTIDFTKK